MAARLLHASPLLLQVKPKRSVDLVCFLLLSLSAPAMITTITYKRRKKHKFRFFLPFFRSALFWLHSFSWFVVFFLSSAGGRSGGWVATRLAPGYCFWSLLLRRLEEGDGFVVADGEGNGGDLWAARSLVKTVLLRLMREIVGLWPLKLWWRWEWLSGRFQVGQERTGKMGMRCKHWEGTAKRGRSGEGLSRLKGEASSGVGEEEEMGTVSVRGRK